MPGFRSLPFVAHVGIGVADLNAALQWYAKVFDFTVTSPSTTVKAGVSNVGRQARNVLGHRFLEVKIGIVSDTRGVGLEFFETIDPHHERKSDPVEYWRSGTFHIALHVDNIHEGAARVVAAGGRQTSEIWQNHAVGYGEMVYLEDPWGTVVELQSG